MAKIRVWNANMFPEQHIEVEAQSRQELAKLIDFFKGVKAMVDEGDEYQEKPDRSEYLVKLNNINIVVLLKNDKLFITITNL